MNKIQSDQIAKLTNFIWNIADDCLRDRISSGEYRNIILPMTVIRRLDTVLESTKEDVLTFKKKLDEAGVNTQDTALCAESKQSFYNISQFRLEDLTSRNNVQQLKDDFITYLQGFSQNVQDILTHFDFWHNVDRMASTNCLGSVIEKFVNPDINLSPYDIKDNKGNVLHYGLDNHMMGTIYEHLLRRFNDLNNQEAGAYFTPRDVVELMADIVFVPIEDKIEDGTYLLYDDACGTGGMLTVGEARLHELAEEKNKKFSVYLYGQETDPQIYAICKADMLIKGKGEQTDNIFFGSTLSNDKFQDREFDFMMSNPPFGKSWNEDLKIMGGKNDVSDSRFVISYDGDEYKMIPRSSDGQLLFLANNVSKMKKNTKLGSRIAEVHNGSLLFTGDAGSGESNFRRYIIENDLVEAIIALPNNIFYNTGIATYIWVLANKKSPERRGKVQLIDASNIFTPLRKNMGMKNCEISESQRKQIVKILTDFEENEYSKIFKNEEFGYYKVTVERPKRDEDGNILMDKKGKILADSELRDTENIPLSYDGGIEAFMKNEVLPYNSDAWIDEKKTVIGYELSFTKYFYKPAELRSLDEIADDIKALECESDGLLEEILR